MENEPFTDFTEEGYFHHAVNLGRDARYVKSFKTTEGDRPSYTKYENLHRIGHQASLSR
jgi:hypothetical protein